LKFLSKTWSRDGKTETNIIEERRVYITSVMSVVANNVPSRFSSFTRLVRVTAYCLRWLRGAKLARGSSLSKIELDNCMVAMMAEYCTEI